VLIDATHRRWMAVTAGLWVVATVAYVLYARSMPGGPRGGTWQGLLFGVAGSALMLFAGLFSARKKVPAWRLGRAQTWLRGHIWLGLLSVPLVAFHAGFRLGGPLELALWALLAAIVLSGVFGLLLQQILPRHMTARLPRETFQENVPYVCELMQWEADAQVAEVCGPLPVECPPAGLERRKEKKHFIYLSEVEAAADDEKNRIAESSLMESTFPPGAATRKLRPKTAARRPKYQHPQVVPGGQPLVSFYLADVRPFLDFHNDAAAKLSDDDRADGLFAQLRAELPSGVHPALARLHDFCVERRQLSVQTRLHRWLHAWVLVHVPLSLALVVLGVAHAVASLYY